MSANRLSTSKTYLQQQQNNFIYLDSMAEIFHPDQSEPLELRKQAEYTKLFYKLLLLLHSMYPISYI